MHKLPHPLELALQLMDDWLGLPEISYKADVYWFAQRLPPEAVLEAVQIAQAKIPDGGLDAFKYFCGICHRKIEKQKIRLSWN
ncbi:MAG: hypothetical protein U1F65_02665 [Verrucomicrobiota bacterium]